MTISVPEVLKKRLICCVKQFYKQAHGEIVYLTLSCTADPVKALYIAILV